MEHEMGTKSASDATVERVRAVVGAVLGPEAERLPASEPFARLPKWDSVNLLHLMIALEAEFGVTIAPEQVADLASVERVLTVLRASGAG
jgi:acyl carrier protein